VKFKAFDVMDYEHVDYFKKGGLHGNLYISSGTRGIVAYTDSGFIMGMVLFDNWTHTAVFGHIVVSNPMCLKHGGLITEAMDFVFNTLGLQYLMGSVPASKEKAISFEKRIGFKEVYRLKDGFQKGTDLIFMQMTRDQAVFLPKEQRAA
jgi:RimJ/RimL family protein N-acetyltransferase